jgi:hypothetical protein
MDDETELVPISALKIGDRVDLEGDRYADPKHDDFAKECEYAVVSEIEVETDDCTAVVFEGSAVSAYVGFPPDHEVRRLKAEPEDE